jgi:F0F1-type ATP synthase membrane subunit b/b'
MRNKLVFSGLVLVLSLAVMAAYAVKPVADVSAKLHPNIAEAQKHIILAYEKIEAAQVANERDLGGHAEKAKALLEQANAELKLAAEASNKHLSKEMKNKK